MQPKQSRVLSIQSHVTHGYVGNRCAAFALQLFGCDVDLVNTVEYSNHVGYGKFRGRKTSKEHFDDIIEGLRSNNLLKYDYVLSGYMGSDVLMQRTSNIVKELKSADKDVIFVCDPVMGDNGKLYVPQELVEEYKLALTIADIITPNQFEAETLSGITIHTLDDARDACKAFHDKGVKNVVVTSLDLKSNTEILIMFISRKHESDQNTWTIEIPKIREYFSGTGDLFSSLLVGWLSLGDDFLDACVKTVNGVFAVLTNTAEYVKGMALNRAPTFAERELRLVQSRAAVENPNLVLKLQQIS